MENQNLDQGPTGSVQLRQELPTVKVTVSGISVIICPRDLPQDLKMSSLLLLAQSGLHSSKYFLELHVCVNVAVAFFGNQNISVEEIIQLKGNSPLCLLWSRLPPTTWTSSLPEVSLVASPVISSLPGNLSSSCCFNFRNLGAYPHPPL